MKFKIAVPRRALAFARDRRATSAVEFGLVATPMVFLMLGICQIGFYYFAQAALDAGVLASGQSLYSGFRTGGSAYTPDAATLKALVANNSGGMIKNNSALLVEIRPIADLAASAVPITDGVNKYDDSSNKKSSTLVLRAKATVPSFAPLFGSLMAATSAVIIRRQGT